MKTRIELSCVEDELRTSLTEVQKLFDPLELDTLEIKVFRDKNRDESKGHSYVRITKKSNIHEILNIYDLSEQVKELEEEISQLTHQRND